MRKDNKISEIQILKIIYDNLANDFYGFEKNLIKSKLIDYVNNYGAVVPSCSIIYYLK